MECGEGDEARLFLFRFQVVIRGGRLSALSEEM